MAIYAALTEGEFSLRESLTFASRLARKLGVSLIGASAMPDPARAVMMTGVSMHGVMIATGGTLLEGLKKAQTEARENLESLFNEVCDAEGVASDQRSIEHHIGLPSEVYPRISLLSEGLVTPHECVTSGSDHGLAFETTLLDRRQPVIACGTEASPDISTMIIAWDGSPQAARAVRFHLGILKAADRVIIAQNADKIDAGDQHGSESPQRVVDYLSSYGITPEVRSFDGNVAEGLLSLSKDVRAGVIVAGAYGHSRLEEMIFGGVSRNLLRSEDGPALALAH